MPFAATWVDLEIIILREARKRKTKYLMIPFIYIYNVDTIIYIYMQNLKCYTNDIIYETESDPQIQRTDLTVAKGECSGEGKGWEFGISRYKLLHVEWIDSRSYCGAHGNVFNIL